MNISALAEQDRDFNINYKKVFWQIKQGQIYVFPMASYMLDIHDEVMKKDSIYFSMTMEEILWTVNP